MAEINRDEDQARVAKLWLESDRKNTLVLGTGYGKSRVAMLILNTLYENNEITKNSKVLLLTNSEELRDKNWKEDFIKWELEHHWNNITSECYQTYYKWNDTKWDLVIADEIDFAMSEELHKTFVNNEFSMILGLTGYVDSSKEMLLESIAPVLETYTTQDAQRDGILNKTQIVFIEFDLSQNKKDITVEYKKGGASKSFTQSENDAYDYIENQWNITYGKMEKLYNDPEVALGIDEVKVKEYNNLKYKLNNLTNKRKELLYNGIASRKTAQDLIKLLLAQNSINKIVTFSSLTEQADKINEFTYHGKNKKDSVDILDKLSSGEIRSVGVCKAIDRGKNISGLNSLIMESFTGSTTQFTQRHGRGTRLNPKDTMNLYILLPYYHKKIKNPESPVGNSYVRRPTQAIKWATSMLEDFKIINPVFILKGVGENDWTRYTDKTSI